MIDLKKIKRAATVVTHQGTAEFRDLVGRAYSMEAEGMHGISFVYSGGKFSARVPADLASGLGDEAVEFSRVVFGVEPASFGREKRSGLRIGEVLVLECGGQAVYRSPLMGPETAKAGGLK